MGSQMAAYMERIQSMTDLELKREWEIQVVADDGELWIRKVEHEMALRFLQRSRSQKEESSYFVDKLLRMPEQFDEAFYRKDWFRAKYLYDSAIIAGQFLEVPEHIRNRIFGNRQDEDNPVEGLFSEDMLWKVMKECVMKNRLGYECMVYRVPGEIGFYGAKPLPGTRYLPAEENPASRAV